MKWFKFNEKRSDIDHKLFITSIERPIMPAVEVPLVKIGKKAGANTRESTLQTLEITINFYIMSDSDAELRKDVRALARDFFTKKEKRLILSDEQDIFYHAKLSGNTDFDTIAATGRGSLTFLCGDPYGYKTTEENLLLNENGTLEVFNDGEPTYPRIRLVPTVNLNHIRIDNDRNTKRILLLGDFLAWEPIIIDNEHNNIYLEQTEKRLMNTLTLSSDFFELESGANELRVLGGANNMIGSFLEDWQLNQNARAIDHYNLELNATGPTQFSRTTVTVTPNETYLLSGDIEGNARVRISQNDSTNMNGGTWLADFRGGEPTAFTVPDGVTEIVLSFGQSNYEAGAGYYKLSHPFMKHETQADVIDGRVYWTERFL